MKRTSLLLLAALLSACAGPRPQPAPAPIASAPAVQLPPETASPTPAAPASNPVPQAPPAKAAPAPRERIAHAVPSQARDRQGWIADIDAALRHLRIPASADNVCALAAVIEQESSWQADPVVPGLPGIVWGKIEEKAHRYLVPLSVVKTALLKGSPNGQSYKARIDNLRTEREMNLLFEDMAREAGKMGLPDMKNPIRTGGPMQVSVEFAEAHAKVWPYPYPHSDSIRHQVFSRRGGVYFGAAILLQYPAPYQDMLYRFADFNAGRYSSRNAAFQAALSRLSGRKLALDGDLLNYQGQTASGSQQAALSLSGRLAMGAAAIQRDLRQEKSAGFGQTQLYRQVFALADQQAGRPLPRAAMPQIDLKSPKISRKLTTEWFANRVDGRYRRCLVLLRQTPAP
ncbi:DUF1615 family protein [Chromobacterium subtsugae]|uniref:DUF1615 family protein n=1 Tax=Chromobacterium subtsugae TaxID=251747 RepID=A0ABS7FAE6_9NEIS|nr:MULTISPECIES: DUF1615 domain-containing protein [Chromobacterium]KUM04554.1 hypothetical protein Cv017_14120 [Chromobacterium subtsugae]KZE87123.1 hypothetical protein AWB61_12290 [Chromobacterium sp. F49]MBW7565933.1 DUF1615 domain-containing protein [Chromobacterium subtsugae]MBW8287027.1 DUF1615 family protein [Chromobacterium subtsugae]WSE93105.1 DUF1615 domain-containing protein [Chromobacterium subtsugae]